MKKYYLAIDMGAASIRIISGSLSEKLTVEEVYRFDNNPVTIDNQLRWNLPYILENIVTGIKTAVEKSPGKIESIGADSWGVDFVLMKDGIPLEYPVSYRDSRTDGMQGEWEKILPGYETFVRTGINSYPFNSLYQFLSIKDSGPLRKADKILFMACYIAYFLSGNDVNELSLCSTSQLLNASTKQWDDGILKELGLTKDKFGKPELAGKIIGKIKPEILNENINVVLTPAHDSASSLVAVPAFNSNFVYISTGTWCVLGTESDTPFINEYAYKNGITNEITYDGKFRSVKNIMGLWLVQQLRKSYNNSVSYDEIEVMCKNIPAIGMTVDADDPSFYNPEDMVSAFNDFLKTKYGKIFSTQGEYFRCAYESLAKSFALNIGVLVKLRGKAFSRIHLIGGGCQSAILCQLTADATGLPVYAGPVEGASIGNILVQAMADGTIKDLQTARDLVRNSFEVKTYLPK